MESCIHDTIVWLSIDQGIVTGNKRLFLACVYIRPFSSKYYKRYGCDLFTELESSIVLYSTPVHVMLIGDTTNSRTATLDNFICSDRIHRAVRNIVEDVFEYDSDVNIPARINPDLGTNSFETKLLNLCKNSGLQIMDGRHQNGLSNDYTYCGPNGMCVIDYVLISYALSYRPI